MHRTRRRNQHTSATRAAMSISYHALRSEEHTSELQSQSNLHSFPTRRSSDLMPQDHGRSVGHAPHATAQPAYERHASSDEYILPCPAYARRDNGVRAVTSRPVAFVSSTLLTERCCGGAYTGPTPGSAACLLVGQSNAYTSTTSVCRSIRRGAKPTSARSSAPGSC